MSCPASPRRGIPAAGEVIPAPVKPLLTRIFFAAALVAAIVVPQTAHAVDPDNPGEGAGPSGETKTLRDYLSDLSSEESPKRMYAVRTVRFETRRALRAINSGKEDSIAWLDAQSAMVELEARAPSGCIAALRFPNSAVPCAEILADLERTEALPVLAATRPIVTGKGPLKRFDAAVARLQALSAGPSAPGTLDVAPPSATSDAPASAPPAPMTP